MTRADSMNSPCFAERLEWNENSSSELGCENQEDFMGQKDLTGQKDFAGQKEFTGQTTRCPICGKRMVPVVTLSGRTDLQCISCDDPGAKWAESPLTAPERSIVEEPV